MKNRILYTLLLLTAVGMWSCKMELEPYNEKDNRIAFVFSDDTKVDSTTRFTFAYFPEDVTEATVYVDVTALGYLSPQDRKVSIRQVPAAQGVLAAEPGRHYVPFDDPSVANRYVIKGDTTGLKLPVVFKRDPSLKEQEYTLEIALVENEYFKLGPERNLVKRITVTDQLTKPNTWGWVTDYFLYGYGTEKHKLMIAAAAPFGVIIDDEWVESVESQADYGSIMYWIGVFKAKLQEINDQRAANGEGPLREGPEYGNVIVAF